jgi:hypothetical protein
MAGPTFPETDTQPVPAMLEPAPASAAASATPEPASHVPEHCSPYWHDVPLSRMHAVPFCGWDVGQPLSATPLSPQSPPTATQCWPLHTRLKGKVRVAAFAAPQLADVAHDASWSPASHAEPGSGMVQQGPTQSGGPPPVRGGGDGPSSPEVASIAVPVSDID